MIGLEMDLQIFLGVDQGSLDPNVRAVQQPFIDKMRISNGDRAAIEDQKRTFNYARPRQLFPGATYPCEFT